MPQQGRIGQFWLLGSGIVLCILAIACAGAAMGAATVMDDALRSTCKGLVKAVGCARGPCAEACDKAASNELDKAKCKADCATNTPAYDMDQCTTDLYKAGKCTCSGSKPDTCDCSGTDIGQIKTAWAQACLGLGLIALAGGIVFTGIPALVAAWKKVPIVNVLCFSICSGLWTVLFLAFGAVFILVGMYLQGPEVKKVMDETCSAELSKNSNDGAGSAEINQFLDCGAKALCDGWSTLIKDTSDKSTAIGIPYFLSGIVMFAGCYVCCVCKNSVPQGPDDNASKVQPFPPPTAPYEQAYPPPGQVPVALAVAPGWEARQDPSGRTYYQNNVTQQTSWEPPPMQ